MKRNHLTHLKRLTAVCLAALLLSAVPVPGRAAQSYDPHRSERFYTEAGSEYAPYKTSSASTPPIVYTDIYTGARPDLSSTRNSNGAFFKAALTNPQYSVDRKTRAAEITNGLGASAVDDNSVYLNSKADSILTKSSIASRWVNIAKNIVFQHADVAKFAPMRNTKVSGVLEAQSLHAAEHAIANAIANAGGYSGKKQNLDIKYKEDDPFVFYQTIVGQPLEDSLLLARNNGGLGYHVFMFPFKFLPSMFTNKQIVALGIIYYDFGVEFLNPENGIASSLDGHDSWENAAAAKNWVTPVVKPSITSVPIEARNDTPIEKPEFSLSVKKSNVESYTNSYSSTIGSSTTQTDTTTNTHSLKLSVGVSFPGLFESKVESSFSHSKQYSDAVSKSFTDTTAKSDELSLGSDITTSTKLSLAPFTAAEIKETPIQKSMNIKYDYPVKITYKVKIVRIAGYDKTLRTTLPAAHSSYGNDILAVMDARFTTYDTVATFGSALTYDSGYGFRTGFAADNLAARYADNGKKAGFAEKYSDSLDMIKEIDFSRTHAKSPVEVKNADWAAIKTYLNYSPLSPQNTSLGDFVDSIGMFQPMSVSGADLNLVCDYTAAQVGSYISTRPLSRVGIVRDGTSQFELDAGKSMGVNQFEFTKDKLGNTIKNIEGFVENDAGEMITPFYGFSPSSGSWEIESIEDADGNLIPQEQWDDIAYLKTDGTGLQTLCTKEREIDSSVLLRYRISETAYPSLDLVTANRRAPARNEDLSSTAKVNVAITKKVFKGSIALSSRLKGYVGDTIDLYSCPDISYMVMDISGKEVSRGLQFVAQAPITGGIQIDEAGQLRCTKPGPYTFRAESGDAISPWVTIEVLEASYLHALQAQPKEMNVTLSSAMTSIALPSQSLTGYDQHGDPWPLSNPGAAVWSILEDTTGVAILSNNSLSLTKPGTVKLSAALDGVSSAALQVNVTSAAKEVLLDGSHPAVYLGGEDVALPFWQEIRARVRNDRDIEIDRPVTFEAQELPKNGIEIIGGQWLRVTKTGSYHIRAICDGIVSPWLTIQAYSVQELSALRISDSTEYPIFVKAAEADQTVIDLNNLIVEGLDQYERSYHNLPDLRWEMKGNGAVLQESVLSVAEANSLYVRASVNHIASDWLPVKLADPASSPIDPPTGEEPPASESKPKGILGTNAKWSGEWWHYLLFFLCFGFLWMW